MSALAPHERVLADFAFDAIHLGLLKPEKVIEWADCLIADIDVPPAWMIDLSMVDPSDGDAVRTALRAVPGPLDHDDSLALLNGLVLREWRAGRLSIGRVRGIGWELYCSSWELFRSGPDQRDLRLWGVVVETDGELVDDAVISEALLTETIDRELSQFEPQLRRLPSWA